MCHSSVKKRKKLKKGSHSRAIYISAFTLQLVLHFVRKVYVVELTPVFMDYGSASNGKWGSQPRKLSLP